MGLFDKLFNKKKLEKTAEEEVLPVLKGLKVIDKPLVISLKGNSYSIVPFPNMVTVSVNGKEEVGVYKYKFMKLEDILYEAGQYYKQALYDKAEESVEQALTLASKLPEEEQDWQVYYLAALIMMRKRMFSEAAGLFSKMLDLKAPQDHQIKALNSMGACCSILGEKQNALEAYLIALKMDENNTETLHNIGGFYWDCNSLFRAAESYLKVLELDKQYIATYEEIGNLLKQLGNEPLGEYFSHIFTTKEVMDNVEDKINEAKLFIHQKFAS